MRKSFHVHIMRFFSKMIQECVVQNHSITVYRLIRQLEVIKFLHIYNEVHVICRTDATLIKEEYE
jgi:hypothetical protein